MPPGPRASPEPPPTYLARLRAPGLAAGGRGTSGLALRRDSSHGSATCHRGVPNPGVEPRASTLAEALT